MDDLLSHIFGGGRGGGGNSSMFGGFGPFGMGGMGGHRRQQKRRGDDTVHQLRFVVGFEIGLYESMNCLDFILC